MFKIIFFNILPLFLIEYTIERKVIIVLQVINEYESEHITMNEVEKIY